MVRYPHSCRIMTRVQSQEVVYAGESGTLAVGDTVTGADSEATAVISRADPLVLRSLSDDFQNGEVISTGTWTATLTSMSDYTNSSGEPGYSWSISTTETRCKFYRSDAKNRAGPVLTQGEVSQPAMKAMFPPDVELDTHENQIVTTQKGFTGTYRVSNPYAAIAPGGGVHHIEAELREAE